MEKSIKVKLILLSVFIILIIISVIGIILVKTNNQIENKIISDVKDFIKDHTFENYDISEITNINITNTKIEQLSDKKQFNIYGTFIIKDNYNNIYSASFKGTYDIVNKDGKDIYYSNQIKSTNITYPNNLPINEKKYQEQVQSVIDEFFNTPIDMGNLIGQ